MGNFQYKMIIDDIINKINNGELSSGDKLPSQREISQYYNVNRSTVIQSLDILKVMVFWKLLKKKAFMYLNINGMLILQIIFIGKII